MDLRRDGANQIDVVLMIYLKQLIFCAHVCVCVCVRVHFQTPLR